MDRTEYHTRVDELTMDLDDGLLTHRQYRRALEYLHEEYFGDDV